MKRVYIPLESVTIAHVVRPLRVAQKLKERGVEVIFGVQDRYRSLIESQGFQTHLTYCEDPAVLLNAVRTLNFRKQIKSLPRYLESDLHAMKSLGKIDLVLADFRFTIRLAAEKLGIPHVALVNGYYSPFYDVIPKMPGVLSRFLPKRVSQNLSLRKMLRRAVLRFQARPYQRLSRRYDVPTKIRAGFDIAVSKTMTLICDLPEFTPQKNLPENYHFVGPILWEPEEKADPVWEAFQDRSRPLIYLTCGTSGDDRSFKNLLQQLKNMPVDVIFSTGSQDFGALPDNVYSIPFVKASDVLQHASLMICHGGNGSIYQALQYGVPVLCLTTFYDQEWNGQRVQELGLGESLYHQDLFRRPLLPIIEKLIEDKQIQANLSRFKDLMSRQDGAQSAAEKILHVLNT